MTTKVPITTSSQLKSANAESEIAYHSGGENREKYSHKNEDIDTSMSYLNEAFIFHQREDLLEKHYREKIDKHNEQNNSASRRWDSMDDFLKSFEGKKVRSGGKETDNERWATMTQISYFGGKDSLGDVIDALKGAGVPYETICDVYAEGYKEYVERHNETFKTLPIYRSDVHFDETTPHGHDAIVVMGHTKKGNPSDSFNNALSEHYGKYPANYQDKKKQVEQYREDNDELIFRAIAPRIEKLAKENDLDIEFEAVRTGEEGSLSMDQYKQHKDMQEREARVDEKRKRNAERSAELRKRELALKDRETAIQKQEEDMKAKRERFKADIAKEQAEIDRLQNAIKEKNSELNDIARLKGFVEGHPEPKAPMTLMQMDTIAKTYTDNNVSVRMSEGEFRFVKWTDRYAGKGHYISTTEFLDNAYDFETDGNRVKMVTDDEIKTKDISKLLYDMENQKDKRSDDVAVARGLDTLRIQSDFVIRDKVAELSREKENERTL